MSIKRWIEWNRPIFMTRSKLFSLLVEDSEKVRKNNDELNWIAISEVIESLKELRKIHGTPAELTRLSAI